MRFPKLTRGAAAIFPFLLSPILAAQAVYVISKALRLPEAAGDRTGVSGRGPDLHLMILGDSSAAGVGVATQASALTGKLVSELSETFRVHWTLNAKTGATTRSILDSLERMTPLKVDAVVLALGVNDSTRLVPVTRWMSQQSRLLELLTRDYGVQRFYVSGVPPLDRFPLLPQPLRWVLGRRAAQLDSALREMLAGRPECTYVTIDLELNPQLMAEDGFHPGPVVYAEWAKTVAAEIAQDFNATSNPGSQFATDS